MSKVYIIAEVGINANGNMEIAEELIEIAHDAGCDAIKFQKRDINLVYSKEELDKPRQSPWGTTTRQQKQGLEFDIEQYKSLARYADNIGLDFIMSCWDKNSLQQMKELPTLKYHKIASAMLTDKEFLLDVLKTGKPIIVSTGMSTQEQVDKAIGILKNQAKYILACTSTYPTKDEEVNLVYITTLKNHYPLHKIGFSNHCSSMLACIGAAALGAECIEMHITKDRTMYGSDQAASIQDVKYIVDGIRRVETMIGSAKKEILASEVPILSKLRKNNTL